MNYKEPTMQDIDLTSKYGQATMNDVQKEDLENYSKGDLEVLKQMQNSLYGTITDRGVQKPA